MLEVLHVPTLVDNYVWLIRQPKQAEVVIVDPGEAYPVLEKIAAEQLKPVAILVTHYHHDHTGGLAELLQHYRVPVYGPGHIRHITEPVKEGDSVSIREIGTDFHVLDVRGHTHDHVAYIAGKLLFCGDVIFSAGCGRLFDGTLEQMAASVARLATLPDDTIVYCAHEYTLANLKFAAVVEPENPDIAAHQAWAQNMRQNRQPTLPTSIGKEKQINPYFRVAEKTVIEAVQRHNPGVHSHDPVQVFIALRRWKDGFRG